MSYGLEVFRSDGTTRVSISDRLTRVFGTATITPQAGGNVFVAYPSTMPSDDITCVAINYLNNSGILYEELYYPIPDDASGGVWVSASNMSAVPFPYQTTVMFLGY